MAGEDKRLSTAGDETGFCGAAGRLVRRVRIRAIPRFLLFLVSSLLLLRGIATAQTKPWVTGYFSGWQLGDGVNGFPPVSAVDFTALTDVVLFSLQPQSDGSLDSVSNSISPAGSRMLVQAAHAAGTKALISIGGWATQDSFDQATSPAALNTFVANLVGYMQRGGFDGIDIDWEPLDNSDAALFKNLAAALEGAVQNISPRPLLTTTCLEGTENIMASVQSYFDRINMMTYDMSGNFSGWVSWYNSPLYNGGNTFPGTGTYLPAIDTDVKAFRDAGVSAQKLGIGAELGGTIWEGITLPLSLLSALTSISYDVPLYAYDRSGIMQQYYNAADYHWDSGAQTGYLSIPGLLGLTGDFISYDDSNSIRAKANYIRQQGLGGIILYELGMGYPGDGTYPLLKSVKSAFAGNTAVSSPTPPSSASATLHQNFPNPFNTTTEISFSIPSAGFVRLTITNILGQEVARTVDGHVEGGDHTVVWDAGRFPTGVYFCHLQFNAFVANPVKLILLK